MEKSRGADDPVDLMSQAINRLRTMVSPPRYSPPMPRPPAGDRGMDGVICGSRVRAVASSAADSGVSEYAVKDPKLDR